VTHSKDSNKAAGRLAAIFERHFASLTPQEREARIRAFDEAVAGSGSRIAAMFERRFGKLAPQKPGTEDSR